MENISGCIIRGDTDELFRSVKGFFFFIQPFISPGDAKKIKNKIKEAKKFHKYAPTHPKLKLKLENVLDDIVEETFKAAKHILLPTRTEEEDDGFFNVEDVI